LIAAGKGSYLDDLLSYAGGQNVLNDSRIPYPKLSLEELFVRNPEVILDMGDFAHAEGKPNERQAEIDKLWGKYPLLRAVQSKTVHALASDLYVVPGPRMLEAAREFRRLLHPEVKP
jgi:iron complex transport system substrate-binding protein